MLLDMAVGDAAGAAFEFAPTSFLLENGRALTYSQHPSRKDHRPGTYTDDTQTTIAMCELILDGKSTDKQSCIEYLFNTYKRNPRPDTYTKGFQNILDTSKSATEVASRLNGNSDKCGSAVRALPFGFFKDIKVVKKLAAEQATATHDHPESVGSSVALALSMHYMVRNLGPKGDLPKFVSTHAVDYAVPVDWSVPPDTLTPVSVKALSLAHRAVWLVSAHPDQASLLESCILTGGDTDSLAAVCMALSCMSQEYRHNIPDSLYWDLEGGMYGRGHLEHLNDRLCDKFEVKIPK